MEERYGYHPGQKELFCINLNVCRQGGDLNAGLLNNVCSKCCKIAWFRVFVLHSMAYSNLNIIVLLFVHRHLIWELTEYSALADNVSDSV